MNIIKAIVIKTNTTETSSDYGLFAVSGENSVFRFAEKQLNGVSDFDHNYSFVTKNGIPDILKSCDLSESGNVVQSNDVTIRLKNTTQFDKFLSSNNISLLKSTIEFYTFVGTDADSDSVGVFIDGIRTVESIEYTETELILKVKMSLSKQRNKRLSVVLDTANYPYVPESNKNKIVPLIFGSSDPVNGRYFKILQSNGKEIKYYSEDWFVDGTPPDDVDVYRDLHCASFGAYEFPQIENETNGNEVSVLGGEVYDPLSGYELVLRDGEWFEGKYLKCIKGKISNQNVIRKISDATRSDYVLSATLQDYLEELPVGNSDYDETDQSYFELYDVEIQYILTYYEILGFFLSSDGTTATSDQPELFAKIDNETEQLMSSSIDIDIENNILTLNPRIFKGDKLTSLYNFSFYKPSSCAVMTYDEFTNYSPGATDLRVYITGTSPQQYVNGLFTTNSGTTPNQATESGGSNVLDRNYNTVFTWSLDNYSGDYIWAYKIVPPTLPENFKFTKCFLGIKCTSSISGSGFEVTFRKNMYPVTDVLDITTSGALGLSIDDIPDFYYTQNAPSTGNKNFFWKQNDGTNGTGYGNFELDINSAEEFNALKWVSAFFKHGSASFGTITIQVTEVCFIFQHEQDITGEFYV